MTSILLSPVASARKTRMEWELVTSSDVCYATKNRQRFIDAREGALALLGLIVVGVALFMFVARHPQ
jgi:hypothetical protein